MATSLTYNDLLKTIRESATKLLEGDGNLTTRDEVFLRFNIQRAIEILDAEYKV
jgi:hypothetical protein